MAYTQQIIPGEAMSKPFTPRTGAKEEELSALTRGYESARDAAIDRWIGMRDFARELETELAARSGDCDRLERAVGLLAEASTLLGYLSTQHELRKRIVAFLREIEGDPWRCAGCGEEFTDEPARKDPPDSRDPEGRKWCDKCAFKESKTEGAD